MSAAASAGKRTVTSGDAERALVAASPAAASSRTPRPRRPHVLRGRAEFESVLRAGARLAGRHFVLRVVPNGMAYARLGIIAGRKAAPRAVDRNRAKRLIREAFRAAADEIGAYDVTIQLRDDLRAASNEAVREDLRTLIATLQRRVGQTSPGRLAQ